MAADALADAKDFAFNDLEDKRPAKKAKTEKADPQPLGELLHPGDVLDLLDTENLWLPAEVHDENELSIRVHYLGLSDKYDEWISKRSHRISAFCSKTSTAKEYDAKHPKPVAVSSLSLPVPIPDFVSKNEELADIELVSSDGKNFKACRLLLSQLSPLFKRMFKEDPSAKSLPIPYDSDILNLCLLWVEDQFPITAAISRELLSKTTIFAHGYEFGRLTEECLIALQERAKAGEIKDLIDCWKLAKQMNSTKAERACNIQLHRRFNEVKDFFYQQLPAEAQALWTHLKASAPSSHLF